MDKEIDRIARNVFEQPFIDKRDALILLDAYTGQAAKLTALQCDRDRLVAALKKISDQGYWGHDTTPAVLVNLLDEYKDLADAALSGSSASLDKPVAAERLEERAQIVKWMREACRATYRVAHQPRQETLNSVANLIEMGSHEHRAPLRSSTGSGDAQDGKL